MRSKEDLKIYCEEKLREVQPYFIEIQNIATAFYTNSDTLSDPQLKPYEYKLVGMFSFINTVYKEVTALKENNEAIYFTNLKIKAEIDSVRFVAESASREAKEFTEDLRLTSALLEGWVENIEQLLTTTRKGIYAERKERKHG
jgi:hypothetical protein